MRVLLAVVLALAAMPESRSAPTWPDSGAAADEDPELGTYNAPSLNETLPLLHTAEAGRLLAETTKKPKRKFCNTSAFGLKGDYAYEACGAFCKQAKAVNHCKFCKCRACTFCANTNTASLSTLLKQKKQSKSSSASSTGDGGPKKIKKAGKGGEGGKGGKGGKKGKKGAKRKLLERKEAP